MLPGKTLTETRGGGPLARYLYYKKTYWKRNLKGWNGSRTKGGEPFDNTDQNPAEPEGSEAVHQTEREAYHPGGINLLHPSGTENQEHDPQGHIE